MLHHLQSLFKFCACAGTALSAAIMTFCRPVLPRFLATTSRSGCERHCGSVTLEHLSSLTLQQFRHLHNGQERRQALQGCVLNQPQRLSSALPRGPVRESGRERERIDAAANQTSGVQQHRGVLHGPQPASIELAQVTRRRCRSSFAY
jgi:hypothetical protein